MKKLLPLLLSLFLLFSLSVSALAASCSETGDHSWDDGFVTTQPGYTHSGVRTFTCTVCGATRTALIPQLTPPGGSGDDDDVDLLFSYTTTINFYDNAGANLLYSISESSENNCPQVTLTCNDNSVDFSGDGISQQPFHSAYPLAGFASAAGSSEIFLAAGKKMAVGGQAQDITVNLYAIPTVSYSTTVNIYDNSGENLLHTYSASADYNSPVVTLAATDTGLNFSGVLDDAYSLAPTQINGFASSPGSSDLYLQAGNSITIGGRPSDTVLNLYIVPVRSYTTTIQIWDYDGKTLLYTYSAEAPRFRPSITVTATENGCTFSGPHNSTFTHTETISGFAAVAETTDLLLYVDGDPLVTPDLEGDCLYSLYLVLPADGELGFLDRIWKSITSLPQKIINLLKPAWLRNLWNSFDFSVVTDFFSEAYDAATHGFYLKDYFEGEFSTYGVGVVENHPFKWLRGD